jgi:hypothetical protein
VGFGSGVLGVGTGLGADRVQTRERDHQTVPEALSVSLVGSEGGIFHEEGLIFMGNPTMR